jgi:hypothetical protein
MGLDCGRDWRQAGAMKLAQRRFLGVLLAGAMGAVLLTGCRTTHKSKSSHAKGGLSAHEAFDIATEAYIFGYPLVTMDLTRRAMTNVPFPQGLRAPMGQFARTRMYPLASNHDMTVPNADMLYTILWLDVSQEPWVVSLPDTHGRYDLFPMLDGWSTVFAAPGQRTTGTGAQRWVITGPGWKGKVPSGLKVCKSPTSMVWMLGRIYCSGTPEDYVAVHKLQDQCSAVPLSAYGKPYTPPPGQVDPAVDMTKPVRDQVNSLNISTYFNLLAMLMKENPPARADVRLVKKMARLGIIAGKPFDVSRLDPSVLQALEDVPASALSKITASSAEEGATGGAWHLENGWMWTLKTGAYEGDYTQRALLAMIGLGANLPQDMVAATSTVDGSGQPYNGQNSYVMHFAPGQAPSANGLWSLTMYSAKGFFAENALGRCALNGRNSLAYNADGSLDLYIQPFPPAEDRESNWLPAPQGKFFLVMRFYWPKKNLLSGSWKMPPVKKAD